MSSELVSTPSAVQSKAAFAAARSVEAWAATCSLLLFVGPFQVSRLSSNKKQSVSSIVVMGSFPEGHRPASHLSMNGHELSRHDSVTSSHLLSEQSWPYHEVAWVSPDAYPTDQSLSQTHAYALSSIQLSSPASPPYSNPFGPKGAALASRCRLFNATHRP